MTNAKPLDSGAPLRQGTIDPRAIVSSQATVHAGAWIGPDVHLAEGVVVGPNAVVGFPGADGRSGPVHIGPKTVIGPGVHVEPDVEMGPDCQVGFGSSIGAGTRLGRGVYVGRQCLLMGQCRLDDFAVLYAGVHVCAHALLGTSCQLMPGVILLNEPYPPTGLALRGPTIGACAVIGVSSVIWPGVRLGYHALVASLSEVKLDVADYALVRGQPAEPVCDVRDIRAQVDGRWIYPYPWMRHHVEGEDITKPAPGSRPARRPGRPPR